MKRVRCKRCGQVTLAGLSNGGRALAQDLTLDLEPLDPMGELAAIVAGRQTWSVHPRMDGADAFHRDAATILARPAGTVARQTVQADHACTEGGVA